MCVTVCVHGEGVHFFALAKISSVNDPEQIEIPYHSRALCVQLKIVSVWVSPVAVVPQTVRGVSYRRAYRGFRRTRQISGT